MVKLIGTPDQVGGQYGKILSSHIKKRIHQYHCERLEQGRLPGKDREMALELLAVLESETPHWIEEYRAAAAAAHVEFLDLLAVNCAAPLTAQPSCTSVMVLGNRALRGFPMLLKIRDERPQHQAMGYKRIHGTHGMLFGSDPCNLGVGQGCNEHGLAVAHNSGGLVPESARPLGLNDCQMARLLLERARDTQEALEVFENLLHKGRVGLVDGVRGMIFLLADARGKGLVIETTRDKYEVLKMDSGLAVWANHWMLEGSKRFTKPVDPDHVLYRSSVLRYERGHALLSDKSTLSAEDLEALSRDEAQAPFSLCNGSDTFPWRTVSAFLYELDPSLSLAVKVAQGLPSLVKYQKVPLWQEETPLSFLLTWQGG